MGIEHGKVYSVTELTRELKRFIEGSFGAVCVRGEISEMNLRSASGHVYLSIKDASSLIHVVFFRGVATCQRLGLGIGSEIEVEGGITIYEPQGSYQIQAVAIRPVGAGSLRLQFEAMKERLRAEGLFDQERKRPIPAYPKCVGVVTSRDGAALQDFLNVLGRRHSGMHVRIFPTLVQGKEAAPRLAAAVNYINRYQLSDVIVVTRGGGSLEDLWPFNEEVLARAIAASSIPVISAVGHERDFSISDFVADLRCATPSVAAELVIASKDKLLERLSNAHQRLVSGLQMRFADGKRRYALAAGSMIFKHPEMLVDTRRQRLDLIQTRLNAILPRQAERARQSLEEFAKRLTLALPRGFEKARMRYAYAVTRFKGILDQGLGRYQERLEKARRMLELLGPRNVLQRGYSILMRSDGQVVRGVDEVHLGEELCGLVNDGKLKLQVSAVNRRNNE